MGLKTQDAKNNQWRKDAGPTVDQRDEKGVSFAVVFCVIIRGVRNNSSESKTQGKEDLGRSISPNSRIRKPGDLQKHPVDNKRIAGLAGTRPANETIVFLHTAKKKNLKTAIQRLSVVTGKVILFLDELAGLLY